MALFINVYTVQGNKVENPPKLKSFIRKMNNFLSSYTADITPNP